GDKGGADRCSRTAAIFNDHWLTELARELIADHTRHNVDDASGRKGDNRSDRFGRPSLCPRFCVREGEGKNRQQYEANPHHAVLPRIESALRGRSATRQQPVGFRAKDSIAHIGPAEDCCAAGFQAGERLLWVISDRSIRQRRSRHGRFAPKADKRTLASICPLSATSGCEQSQQGSPLTRSPRRQRARSVEFRGRPPWRVFRLTSRSNLVAEAGLLLPAHPFLAKLAPRGRKAMPLLKPEDPAA